MRFRLLLGILFVALASVASAQSVAWVRGVSPNQLDLEFTDCEPSGTIQPPLVAGLTFTQVGTTRSVNMVNGVTTSTTAISFRIDTQSSAQVTIPSFQVQTSAGTLTVPEFNGTITPPQNASLVRSEIALPKNTFWVGEVFPLSYTVTTPNRLLTQIASDPQWDTTPLIAEDFANPEGQESIVNGERMLNIVYRTRAYAKAAGQVTLQAAQQLLNMQTGGTGFGFGLLPRIEQVTVTSNRPIVTIRPLPSGAPSSFRGAVGQFKLTSSVVPTAVTVGEPVTWNLTLTGTGNWPDQNGLPPRDVSTDFQAVQPTAKRTPVEGKIFESTLSEDVVLVPTRPGTYKLGPVAYSYFDPTDGKYHTIRTDEATVEVTDPNGLSLKMPPPQPVPTAPTAGGSEGPQAPAPPGVIPRDPLPGSATASAPLPAKRFALVLSVPPGLLLLGWFCLAWRRAVLTDPQRSRRLAERRLKAVLARMRGTKESGNVLAQLLLEWQRAAAQAWGVAHAAPPSSVVSDSEWMRLWDEADRAMYSASAQLPNDWQPRAVMVLSARRLKPFNFFRALHWRNLFPFFVVVLAFASPAVSRGADAINAYNQGDFSAAESAWRADLRDNPRDWIGHHNLALALAQQDRWPEAAGHASVAFVQNPRNPSVRWHLTPVLTEAAFAPALLLPFVQEELPQQLARLASPAEWQLVLVGATALLCLAAGLGLARLYGGRSRWITRSASACFIVALIVGAAGIVSLKAYGMAADSRAVLAWHASQLYSIPTEADTTQKTTALPPGSVAIADRTFLGWIHLTFPNGQTGWVRSGEVIGFWR